MIAISLSHSKPLSKEWQIDLCFFEQIFSLCCRESVLRLVALRISISLSRQERILGRLRVTSHPVLLLASVWPKQPRYSSLMELSVTCAVCLPSIVFPSYREFHTSIHNVQASCLYVVADGYRRQGYSACTAASWLNRDSLQQVLSTPEGGTFSALNVQRDRPILSLSLQGIWGITFCLLAPL